MKSAINRLLLTATLGRIPVRSRWPLVYSLAAIVLGCGLAEATGGAVDESIDSSISRPSSMSLADPARSESDSLPVGLGEAFAEARHAVEAERDGHGRRLFAQNPGSRLLFRFSEDGLLIEPGTSDADWKLSMSLTAWGQPGVMSGASSAKTVVDGRRVEYRRPGITEWYVNHNRGLEQGFTLARPDGYDPEQPLIVAIDLDGGPTPTLTGGGRGLAFHSPDHGRVFDYSGLVAFDADGEPLPARLALTATGFDIRVDAGDGAWPVTIDPVIFTDQKVHGLHDDRTANAYFGHSVAVSGDTVVLGAAGDNPGGISGAGSAYVFRLLGSGWEFEGKLVASNAAIGDKFGASVSIDDDTIAVGAPNADNGAIHNGSVYVFLRTGTDWMEQGELQAADGADLDMFGSAVSVSGNSVLIGASGDDIDTDTDQGSAYVFVRSSGAWSQQAKLIDSAGRSGDEFGSSVDLSGDIAIVGAPLNNTGGVDNGAVLILTRTLTVWTEEEVLAPSTPEVGQQFGASVALTSDTVVAGAPHAGGGGATYVFAESLGAWYEQARLVPSTPVPGSGFGFSVDADQDSVIIGTPTFSGGAAYLFDRSGTTWTETAVLTASDGQSGDEFGHGVALDAGIVVVGARYGADGGVANCGSAYAFTGSGSTWTQAPKLTATRTEADDTFGYSVAMSGDTAAVGAPGDDGAAVDTGAVYVLVRSNDSWAHQQKLTAADGQANDEFGTAVSLSNDTLIAGAPLANGIDLNSGAAYAFDRHSDVWSQTAKLTASAPMAAAEFGIDVSIDGNLAVIGAVHDTGAAPDSGSAYLFLNSGSSWSQQAKLTASDGATLDFFGDDVDVSGDTVLVGAFNHGGLAPGSGAAYVYTESGGVWSQQAKLVPSDGAENDSFGQAVSILGDTALVGAPGDSDAGTLTGAAYVFVRSGTQWKQQAKLTDPFQNSHDYFGRELELSHGAAAIGAVSDHVGVDQPGSAHLFVRGGWGWLHSAMLVASDGSNLDGFGLAVAVDENALSVGSWHDDHGMTGDAGSAYLYDFPCGFGAGVEPGRWTMLGMPCNLGSANTVTDVFGDTFDMAEYGLEWILYGRNEASDAYVELNATSRLDQGEAYWIYSTDWGVWDATGTETSYTQSGLCRSPKGCYEVPLVPPDAPTTHRWNFVGHPGNTRSNWSGVAVIVDGTRYSPAEAEDAGFISKTIHTWVGTAYEAFDDVTPGMEGYLDPSHAYWVEALPDSSGYPVSLLIPDGLALGLPPGPPGDLRTGSAESEEWFVRIIAESSDGALVDRGNVLGQIVEADDGHDPYDLAELDPFGDAYLTVVFPHPQWGVHADDYTSDYHLCRRYVDDEWIFEVRSDDPNREVRLAWEPLRVLVSEDPEPGQPRQWVVSGASGNALLNTMWLQDLASGELVKASTDGEIADYTFNMNDENVRVFRWFAELTALEGIFADDFESGDTSAWTEEAR